MLIITPKKMIIFEKSITSCFNILKTSILGIVIDKLKVSLPFCLSKTTCFTL